MKILITGATGLVGKAITDILVGQNIGVHYLTTSREKLESSELVKGFYWNPRTGEIDMDCFKGVTAIINLAGASISERWTQSYKNVILKSRIQSLQTLKRALEKIDRSTITSFVSASAIGIYPDSLGTLYKEEDQLVDDSFLGAVVKAWEEQIDTFRSFEFPVAKIRIGLVLSVNGGALPKMVKPIQYCVGAPFGTGEQWQSWIHIDDLARMFLFLVENKKQGVFNGVAPNPVTNTKLTKEIAEVVKRPLILPNIPKIVMKMVLGEMSYLLFASQRVSSKKVQESGFEFEFHNVNGALENLLEIDAQNETDANSPLKKEYV